MSDRTYQRGTADTLDRGPKHVSDDYSMKPGDFQVVAESAGGAVVVTLPAKAEAVPGMVYCVHAPAGATADVSVFDKEAGTEHANGDLDADGDVCAVVCTGELWIDVGSVAG